MIGKGDKFRRFESEPFELPKQIDMAKCEFKNERHFIEFLVRNEWIQRLLGVRMPKVTTGFFPDLKSFILPDRDNPNETPINIEVEFWAENYIAHGHSFRGCDLIISFYRSPETRFVKGIPVWSFYECYKNDKWGLLCLDRDIRYNFDEHIDEDTLSGSEYLIYKNHGEKALKRARAKKRKQETIDDSIG